MKSQNFDHLISQIREDDATEDMVRQAADRVRKTLSQSQFAEDVGQKLRSCPDFESLIPAYLTARLTPARTLLLENHLHECVACRHALDSARNPSRPSTAPRRVSSARRPLFEWALAGALAAGIVIGILAGAAGLLPGQHMTRATVASLDGEGFSDEASGGRLVHTGYKLADGDQFGTAKGSHAELELTDGSEIEIDERSQISISRGWHGTTIHLDGGNIIVEAAHRRRGQLYVATNDCLVSSKGTVFLVNDGIKGTRVSVLEGVVNVAYGNRNQELEAGDQVTSTGNVSKVPIRDEVAWSKNAAKYLGLLGEFRLLQRQWEAIPGPGLRYQSDLLEYIPENTVMYASIPNIGSTLGQAKQLFEDRLRLSPVLREWWTQEVGQQGTDVENVIGRLQEFSSYVGDEVGIAVARTGTDSYSAPLLLADLRRPGLREFLERQNQELSGQVAFQIIDNPALRQRSPKSLVLVYLTDRLMVASPDALALRRAIARLDERHSPAFRGTPFYQKITQSYRDGAGWLFSLDMEQILRDNVPTAKKLSATGFEDLKYLVIERRTTGRTETRASITFSPERKGMAAWLAEPAPMGSLDFVSPEASLAASLVIKDPKSVMEEILQFAASSDPYFEEHREQVESSLGVSIRDDIAAALGGEFTVALDGPILPVPSWTIAVEVYDRDTLQSTISKLIDSFNRQASPEAGRLQLTRQPFGSQTYFTLRHDKSPGFELDYTFADSYWILGPSRFVLARAIQNREAGYVLTRSQAFQQQLPSDGYTNFSAIFYHNLAPALAPLAQQLKTLGALSPDLEHELEALGENSAPGLIYAYAEPDRIVVASSSGFMGMNLDTLLGISQGSPSLLSQLLTSNAGRSRGSDSDSRGSVR